MSPRLVAVVVIAAAAAGCDDGDCIDGVCADFQQAVKFPGPCRSAGRREDGTSSVQRTYAYDDAGRIAEVTGDESDVDHDVPFQTSSTTTWHYDTAGQVDGVVHDVYLLPDHTRFAPREAWLFEPNRVMRSGSIPRVYDRSLFSFMPLLGASLAAPSAELGMIEDSTTHVWEIVDPHLWISRIEGSTVETRYELDDRGRLIRSTWDGDLPFYVRTWTYDGDLLLADPDLTHRYDRAGNLVDDTGGGWREIYSYDCW